MIADAAWNAELDTAGQWLDALPIVSTRRQLTLQLDGGTAELFKFKTGAPFVVPEPGGAMLLIAPAVAALRRGR